METKKTQQELAVIGGFANVHLYSDCYPVKIVRVNAKSVVVRRLKLSDEKIIQNPGEPFPAIWYPAIDEFDSESTTTFRLNKHGRYSKGSIGLSIKESIDSVGKFVDWRV